MEGKRRDVPDKTLKFVLDSEEIVVPSTDMEKLEAAVFEEVGKMTWDEGNTSKKRNLSAR